MLSDALQILAIALACGYPLYDLRRSERRSNALILAVLLWLIAGLGLTDYLLLKLPGELPRLSSVALYCTALLCPVGILFSNVYCREPSILKLSRSQYAILALSLMPLFMVVAFPSGDYYYSPDFNVDRVLFLEPVAFFFYLQLLLFLTVALFNLEATVANAPHGVKWKIKLFMVGIGTIIASHALYFSQGLIFRAIDTGFVPTRSLGVVIGVLLMGYSTLSRGRVEKIVISRRLAYRSFVVLFCALFFLAVGLIGEGVRIFGHNFNSYATTMLAVVVGVGVVVIALSERVRRKVRLTLQKHLYGEKYDYRIEWKKFTDLMTNARTREAIYKNVLVMYCETFGVVGGCIFLQGRHSSDFAPVCFHEMDASSVVVSGESEFVRLLRERTGIIDLRAEDLTLDEEMRRFLSDRSARFIVPIRSGAALVGVIILGAPINFVEQYDAEDLELMDAISRHAAAVLMNLRLGDELAEARDMEAFGKVAAFVLHDLKNQVYPLSLLEENAREYINDPEFQKDLLDSLSNIVGRMNALIAQLTNIPSKGTLKLEAADLMTIARDVGTMVPDAEIEFGGESAMAMVDVTEIKKVALNLYLNAMESGAGRRFQVRVENAAEGPTLKVIDAGKGIDREILEGGLFVPFRTTKKKGMGIGLYQCKQIVDAHGGRIVATSPDEGGAVFTIVLPPVEATDNG